VEIVSETIAQASDAKRGDEGGNDNSTPPPWFDKMKMSLLDGMDAMMDRKMQPQKKDIQDIQSLETQMKTQTTKTEEAFKLALDAKSSVQELRDEIAKAPAATQFSDVDLKNRILEVEAKMGRTSLGNTSVMFGNLETLSWAQPGRRSRNASRKPRSRSPPIFSSKATNSKVSFSPN